MQTTRSLEEQAIKTYLSGRSPIASTPFNELSFQEQTHLDLIYESVYAICKFGLSDYNVKTLNIKIRVYREYMQAKFSQNRWSSAITNNNKQLQQRLKLQFNFKGSGTINDQFLTGLLAKVWTHDTISYFWLHEQYANKLQFFEQDYTVTNYFGTYLRRNSKKELAQSIFLAIQPIIDGKSSDKDIVKLLKDQLHQLYKQDWSQGRLVNGLSLLCCHKSHYHFDFLNVIETYASSNNSLIKQSFLEWREELSISEITKIKAHTVTYDGLSEIVEKWILSHQNKYYTSQDIHDCYNFLIEWAGYQLTDEKFFNLKYHFSKTLGVNCIELSDKQFKHFVCMINDITKNKIDPLNKNPVSTVIIGGPIIKLLAMLYNCITRHSPWQTLIVIEKNELIVQLHKALSVDLPKKTPGVGFNYDMRSLSQRLQMTDPQRSSQHQSAFQQYSMSKIAAP